MADTMLGMKRSCRVAEIDETMLGQNLCLMGWCHKQRDLGGLIFITLRDRSGEMQLVFDEDCPAEVRAKATEVRGEFVLACKGVLRLRSAENTQMKTGRYELAVTELRILSTAQTPPFYIEDQVDSRESLRLEYRYLDLRRPSLQERIMKRHAIVKYTRDWFDRAGFIDIETPTLILSTPEGARDYLVPSRVYPGKFFALPQSPQIYKQLLMLAGFDRYMQIARCYRDEDLRADRQPEFTQIDLEMAFVDEEDVYGILEGYLSGLFKEILGVEVQLPLLRLTYEEAMARFGSDKPDMRFGLEIRDVSELAKELAFPVFQAASENGQVVRAICAPGAGAFSRREMDQLTEVVKTYRAKGLVWLALGDEPRGPIAKHLNPEWTAKLVQTLGAGNGDCIFFVADEAERAAVALGQLRLELGRRLNLIKADDYKLLWVTEFPMFEYDEEEKRCVAKHHPFTSPRIEELDLLDSNPLACRARAYDIILNGTELGGGSIRIHDQALQSKIFGLLGMSEEEAERRFGFLLKAFRYGVPPHGGLALGLDRLVMLLCGVDNIREVIAFPKVQNSSCLMAGCPEIVDPKQLLELGIGITAQERTEADHE